MFVHQSQLRHLLTPDKYCSDQQHRIEAERLFLPAWHFVGTLADLARHGDFLTLDLADRPVLVRNIHGQIHAFLNVCAHRHCLLTSKPQGSDPDFRCQYHGWEYTSEGRTARIPDAPAFRPFDRENAQLHKYRVALCGEAVFVSLAEEGPSLADYLGPNYELWATSFAPPFRQAVKWSNDFPCNWKIPVEISLESYHIPCIHPETFGDFPDEEDCEHELNEKYTTFRTPDGEDWLRSLGYLGVRLLGSTPTHQYVHHHTHPNLLFSSMDMYRLALSTVPTSPTTCRQMCWLYTLRGAKPGILPALISRLMRRFVAKEAKQILLEDMSIFADVQRGMKSSVRRGVLGTREERVYVFQKFVADACSHGESEPREDAGQGGSHASDTAINGRSAAGNGSSVDACAETCSDACANGGSLRNS